MKPVLIIGAGIGGLATAIRLAAQGQKVLIYEKNQQVGGKMSQIEADGFRWDTGPSVITMRPVFAELFAAAGRKLEDYLTLHPVEPLTRYFYPDRTVFDATRDLAAMAAQIEAIEPHDVEGFLAYLAYAARIHRITGPVFIYDQPPTWRSFLRVPVIDWLKVDGLRSMDKAIGRFVRSPQLKQLFGRFATYVGASPYQAPATLNVIAHVELTGGVWYPQGGIYELARAMQRLATELGVTIHTNHQIKQIQLQNGRATGIILENGAYVEGSAVISNLDVNTTRQHLLPEAYKSPPATDVSCSGFVLLLGIDKQYHQLAHHNIFFSNDYPAEFDAIFKKGVPPQDPTIYVAITSKRDPDHAPPGMENWFVLVNAPALNDHFDWEKQKRSYRDLVLERLAEQHGLDVRQHIVHEQILTPGDLAAGSGAWRGALYGASSNNPLAAFRRPHNRSDIPGLYFVGGTTHPGGGVPMVTLSGKVTANLVIQDLQKISSPSNSW